MAAMTALATGALLAPLALSGCGKPGPQTNAKAPAPGTTARRYTHEALGFSIAFPDDWDVRRDFESRFAFMGVSPKEGEDDPYGENVNVMAMSTPPGMSLEDFSAIQIQQARELLDNYARRGQSFETVNGERAARFDYAHTVDNQRIVSITHILLRDNIAYAITCSATLEQYDRYRAKMLEITNSFRFTE